MLDDINKLRTGVYWLLWTFEDGSSKKIQTTLDTDYVTETRDGYLFDLNTYRWFRIDSVKDAILTLHTEEPEFEHLKEANKFANQFVL